MNSASIEQMRVWISQPGYVANAIADKTLDHLLADLEKLAEPQDTEQEDPERWDGLC